MSNGLPAPPARKTTPTQEELLVMRNAANVRALKDQLLSSSAQATTPPSPRESPPQRAGQKVKKIIAHMTSFDDSDLTPPPSPLDSEIASIRNSSNITDKITHLTQTIDTASAETSRSYMPPPVRRRVVSPFLERGRDGAVSPTSSSSEQEAGHSQEEGVTGGRGSGTESRDVVSSGDGLKPLKESTDEACVATQKVGVVIQKEGVAVLEEAQQERDAAARKDTNRSLLRAENLSPPSSSEQAPPPPLPVRAVHVKKEGDLTVLHSPKRSKHSAQKRRKETTPPLQKETTPPLQKEGTPPPQVLELDQEPRSLGRSHSHRETARREELESLSLGRKGVSRSQREAAQPWEVESQSLGRRGTHDANKTSQYGQGGREAVAKRELESPYGGRDLPRIDTESPYAGSSTYGGKYEDDDDHLVAITLPYRPPGSKTEPRMEPKKSKKTEKKGPHPTKKLSKPLSLDDVFLSFQPSGASLTSSTIFEATPNRADAWGALGGGHEHTQSATHVELNISANENGLLFPPQLTSASSDHPLMEAHHHHYDRLPKRSEYDHLPPLEAPPPDYEFYRPRSTSDVSSHRVRPRSKQEDYTASEVSGYMCTYMCVRICVCMC